MRCSGAAAEDRDADQSHHDGAPEESDALAVFLSDPESHHSDILYLYFRIYKKTLLWDFTRTALAGLHLNRSESFSTADFGASMGFDALYLLRMLTRDFSETLPCNRVCLSLAEGDQKLIAGGQRILERTSGRRLSARQSTLRWAYRLLGDALSGSFRAKPLDSFKC
jgi:hypothetical protein